MQLLIAFLFKGQEAALSSVAYSHSELVRAPLRNDVVTPCLDNPGVGFCLKILLCYVWFAGRMSCYVQT